MNEPQPTDRKLLAPGMSRDALAEAQSLIGMPIRVEQWNYEASRDVIRHSSRWKGVE